MKLYFACTHSFIFLEFVSLMNSLKLLMVSRKLAMVINNYISICLFVYLKRFDICVHKYKNCFIDHFNNNNNNKSYLTFSFTWCQHITQLCKSCFFSLRTERGLIVDRTGLVLLWQQGTWISVCSEGWNQTAATVVCRQSGFHYGHAYTRLVFFLETKINLHHLLLVCHCLYISFSLLNWLGEFVRL